MCVCVCVCEEGKKGSVKKGSREVCVCVCVCVKKLGGSSSLGSQKRKGMSFLFPQVGGWGYPGPPTCSKGNSGVKCIKLSLQEKEGPKPQTMF